MNFPVNFVEKAREAAVGSGYPIQISATDLMKNFNAAALNVENSANGSPQPFAVMDKTVGGGMVQKQLLFSPAPPAGGGTFIFGFKDGAFTWLATEEC